ncbi:MAG: FtsW/RodA/SpoVE family cell cycle protein [Deltaproteobacteria bacterium]|nr:FtsW/RodA/SpoVE family cell cycle protein [Deltaproteobacteria bacterium]
MNHVLPTPRARIVSMVLASVILVAIGLICLRASLSWRPGYLQRLPMLQLLWVGIGAAAGAGTCAIGYRRVVRAGWALYAIAVALVLATFLFHPMRGVSRWLTLGPLTVQPSEFLKIALVIALAKLLARPAATLRDQLRMMGGWVLIVIAFLVPILRQPALGTAIVLLSIAFAMLALLAPHWWMPASVAAFGAVAAPLVWRFGLHSYQRARVLVFWDGGDEQGAGYQAAQSLHVFGSGGLLGQGSGSFEHALPYPLSDAHSDFVVTVWAHERGLVGVALLLAIYLLLAMIAIRAARGASERAGSAIALGVGASLVLHVMINVGMAMGMLPVVGVPLPLVSYGGSNVLSTLVGLGLVTSVLLSAPLRPRALLDDSGSAR